MSVPFTLNRYDLDRLTVGTVTPVDVCDKTGRVLVRHGSTISEDLLSLIHKRCSLTFYSPHEWPEATPPPAAVSQTDTASPADGSTPEGPGPAEAGLTADEEIESAAASEDDAGNGVSKTVAVDSLRVGMRIAHSIWDERGVLLLAANATITPRFLQLLCNRDLRRVTVRQRPFDGLPKAVREQHTLLTERLDALLQPLAQRGASPRGEAWSRRGHLEHAELQELTIKGLETYGDRISDFEEATPRLLEGRDGQIRHTRDLLETFLDSIELDQDIIPCLLALRQTPHEYLYHHSMNVSLLAMTMAAQLGYSRPQVFQVGIAGLLQDLGMLEVDPQIRMAPRPLEPGELLEVKRHPIHTVSILGRNRGIDPVALFAAYQVHERYDGSGYPRGRKSSLIHPFARIIAVADVYCAMTCQRPYRNPLRPYDAMAAILGEAVFGSYDAQALRALIDCMSLYPVGSMVKLNDGQRGRVMRSAQGAYDRPVLSMQNIDHTDTGEILDLRQHLDLKVVRILS